MPPGQPSPAGGTPSWDGVGVAMALNAVILAAVVFIVMYDSMSFVRTVETTVAGWLGLPSSAVPSTCNLAVHPEQHASHNFLPSRNHHSCFLIDFLILVQ